MRAKYKVFSIEPANERHRVSMDGVNVDAMVGVLVIQFVPVEVSSTNGTIRWVSLDSGLPFAVGDVVNVDIDKEGE